MLLKGMKFKFNVNNDWIYDLQLELIISIIYIIIPYVFVTVTKNKENKCLYTQLYTRSILSLTGKNISGLTTDAISESDIRLSYVDIRNIISAANNATGGAQRQFYSNDGGETWHQTNLPLVLDDVLHRHPSVDWTSDQTAWAVT